MMCWTGGHSSTPQKTHAAQATNSSRSFVQGASHPVACVKTTPLDPFGKTLLGNSLFWRGSGLEIYPPKK